MTFNIGIVCL